MKNQQQVWNKIAEKWNQYRQKPQPQVIKFLKKQKGKILDFGCGSGRYFIKSKALEFYGIDFSKKLLKYAENKKIAKQLKLSQATKIPHKNNFFDSAIFIAVLHCLKKQEQEKSLKELYRVLKPNSKAFISVWSRNQKRLKNKPKQCFIPWTIEGKKQKRYTYIYNKQELKKQLQKTGFKIIKIWEDKNINVIVEKPT